MDKVRIGFVGTGRMGQCAHLKNYSILKDCTVTAIAEPRKYLAERVAQKYGVPKVYNNYSDMLSEEKLDGIVASQQFSYHWKIVPEILKAGIPVFIEKSLACSVQQGEKILSALKNSGTWLMVGYHKRNDPAIVYAKDRLDKWKSTGEMGELRYIRISMNGSDWIAGGFNDLITTKEQYPAMETEPLPDDMDGETFKKYVLFVNFYIHQINLLRYLFSEPYHITYTDTQGTLLTTESESGKTGILEMSTYNSGKVWHETVFVAMNKGFIEINLPAPLASYRAGKVRIFSDTREDAPAQTIVPQMPRVHAMLQQARNFVESIQGRAKPLCEAAEALEDLKTVREYFKVKEGL